MNYDNLSLSNVCINDGTEICLLSYACDSCSYNYDEELVERLEIGL